MNWLYYLLEANLYLALFYGCYRLLFHKETFYTLNRYFLISSTLLSFVLPLLQIGYLNRFFQDSGAAQIPATALVKPIAEQENLFYPVLTILYWLVVIFFSLKLGRGLYQIIALSRKTERHHDGEVVHISIEQGTAAFSFFNLLFIQPDAAGKETILKHEMVHIRQKHSLDILFFEIVQTLNWFNPISYLIKKDIKLLHEYIADELTTKEEIRKHDYALFLIRNSFGAEMKQLSNQIFNPSILKQRINMLNKEKSTGRARLKLLFALPLVGGMLLTSTVAFTKDYGLLDFYPDKMSSINSRDNVQDTIKKKEAKKNHRVPGAKVLKANSGYPAPPMPKSPPPPPPREPGTPPTPPREPGTPPAPPLKRLNKIKFPPPIVTPDRPVPKEKRKSKVKFPPPIVTFDQPKTSSKPVEVPSPPKKEPTVIIDGPAPESKLNSVSIKGNDTKEKPEEIKKVKVSGLTTVKAISKTSTITSVKLNNLAPLKTTSFRANP
ncbi:BlaR1 peptidase M56 [Pedobacter caeni]|uniref:BlaR1 peptidase M56 n=2 Tax=Pedobacter caeni TaxID=288992 RepID=A0A1M5JHL4_9SPHI|nr:BlaR1 peptidase M56 [Pedobacter caeni]